MASPLFRGGAFFDRQREVKKIKKRICLPLAAIILLLLCTACAVKGNALPDGMEEDTVLLAGLGVMRELTDGEYESVYESLRADVREQTTAEAIGQLMETAADRLGAAGDVTDTLVTGVTDTDEPHAIAVIRRKYEKKSVYFRIAYDTEMQLIGLEIKRK